MDTTTNINFVFPFASIAKERTHNGVSMTFQREKKIYRQIDFFGQMREKNFNFLSLPLAVILESPLEQL